MVRSSALALLVFILGCSSPDADGSNGGGEPGPAPEGDAPCFGDVRIPCEEIRDIASCYALYDCEWDVYSDSCLGWQWSCDWVNYAFEDGPSESTCLQLLCSWRRPDGTIEEPDLSGRCEGTAIPCEEVPLDQCTSQPGCWAPLDACERTDPTECAELNTPGFVPARAHEACVQRAGCSWRRGDGTVERAPDLAPPI